MATGTATATGAEAAVLPNSSSCLLLVAEALPRRSLLSLLAPGQQRVARPQEVARLVSRVRGRGRVRGRVRVRVRGSGRGRARVRARVRDRVSVRARR